MNKQHAMELLDQVENDIAFAIDAMRAVLTDKAGVVSVNDLRAGDGDDGGLKTRDRQGPKSSDPFRTPLAGDYD